jgi:hypothetical protein
MQLDIPLARSAQIAGAAISLEDSMIRLVACKPTLSIMGIPRPGRVRGSVISGMLLVALGAAGCGGSSSTKSTTTAAITKAEFVAKANAICGSADPALSVAGAKLATHPTPATIASVVKNTYVPSVEAQITGIRALGTPSGDQATVARMLQLVQADLNKIKRDPRLITTDVFGDFAKVAHPYGLTACAPLS